MATVLRFLRAHSLFEIPDPPRNRRPNQGCLLRAFSVSPRLRVKVTLPDSHSTTGPPRGMNSALISAICWKNWRLADCALPPWCAPPGARAAPKKRDAAETQSSPVATVLRFLRAHSLFEIPDPPRNRRPNQGCLLRAFSVSPRLRVKVTLPDSHSTTAPPLCAYLSDLCVSAVSWSSARVPALPGHERVAYMRQLQAGADARPTGVRESSST